MTTHELLKDTALHIITFASDPERGSKTWDQQPSAPEGGFTDRAGFVMLTDVETYADVALVGQDEAVLRARIAKVTGEGDAERFCVITLDFSADPAAVQSALEAHATISRQDLADILSQETTTPSLVQVSYNTGAGSDGNPVGTRYEYSGDQLTSLTAEKAEELAKTLELAWDSITSTLQ